MTRRMFGTTLGLALWLSSSLALAVSDDLSPTSPMTLLQLPTETRAYALTAAGNVVWRSSATRTWTRVSPPADGSSFYLVSGVAGAVPDSAWGYSRVFAISATDGTLRELRADDGTWRSLGNPGVSLAGAPFAAAAAPGSNGYVAVAVRLSNGHIWTCHLGSSASSCIWEDESIRRGTHLASGNSIEIAYNPYTADVDVFSVASGTSNVLQRYSWRADQWQNLPALPTSPYSYVLDGSISAAGPANDFRVLVTAWDQYSVGDVLFVASSSNGGSTWTWTQLAAVDSYTWLSPNSGVNWQGPAIDQVYGTYDGWTGFTAFFTNAYMVEGWACHEPSSVSGGTATCWGYNGGLPPDLKPGRDIIGPSIVGSVDQSGSNGYTVGQMRNISVTSSRMDYLFDMEVRAPLFGLCLPMAKHAHRARCCWLG